MSLDMVFVILIIIFSAIVHEVMHGVAADRLGDPTARYAGRLTLNPIPHIDLYGSIIVPVFLTLVHSPVFFAWAKPVPYNPYNLRPGRFSEAIVAAAGPFSNIVIALLTGAIIRLAGLGAEINSVLLLIVVVNVMLCIFNLIPVPPLDGSKVLESFLPRSLQYGYQAWRHSLERNPVFGMMLVLLFIYVFGGQFGDFVYSIASKIAGI
ncbi:MAG: site-2 protease family protein [Candidatus Kaiserbacteria bacterium]|nr:site-2 protease family protein [Candidatus Kaiserbacteria bacterium]